MSDIVLTHEIMRKLAASISKIDGRALRHFERINLVAEAFGWQGDALMHHLKAKSKASAPMRAKPSAKTAPMCVDNLGIADVAALKRMFSKENGIILVVGPTDSGKTTTASATVRDIMEHTGRVFYDPAMLSPPAPDASPGVTFLEIRYIDDWRDVVTFSERGHIVVASIHGPNGAQTILSLLDQGAKTEDFSHLIGTVSQRLVRKAGETRKTLLSEVMEFKDHDVDETALQAGKWVVGCAWSYDPLVDRGMISTALELVDAGKLDPKHLEAMFGVATMWKARERQTPRP